MTGLVLAGGGAKGAYQIGVWEYLREQGIEFDVISGTSIGALNAALVASGDLDKAQTFWRALSTRRLVRIEPLLLLGLVLRLFSIVLPGRRLNQIHSARQLRYSIKFNAIVAVALAGLFIVPAFFLSMPASVLLSSSALVVLFLVVLLLLPNITELINGALISRRALSRLVEENVDWMKIAAGRPAVFVTIARVARVRHSRKVTLVIPDYVRLSTLDTSQARDCLTASMSMPFGIFPRIEIDSKRYMDGGVADNIPVYPTVLEECRVIYVVHLSPKPRHHGLDLLDDEQLEAAITSIDLARNKTGEPGLYQRNWFKQRLETTASMRALGLDDSGIWDYMEKRFDRPGDGNVEFVHIVPQRRLGWGLLGTLIFCRAKTERLMARGYEDARATLSKQRPLPASRPGWQERWERRGFLLSILVRVLVVLGMLGLLLLVRYLKSGS